MTPDLRPNFIERLFLLLDQVGAESILHFGIAFDRALDEARLVDAVGTLLADVPRLATVVRVGPFGFRRVAAPRRAAALVTRPDDLEAWRAAPFDLASAPPLRFALGPDGRLWASLHHSVTDARGGWHALAHLGACYAALDGGPVAVPPPRLATDYTRGYFAPLPGGARTDLFRSALTATDPIAHALGRPTDEPYATFTDRPLPATGRLRQVGLLLAPDRVSALLRAAAKRRASPTDLGLAAAIHAALDVWPGQRDRPVRVSLPVDLRTAETSDVANRAGIHDFTVRGAGGLDALLSQIRPETARARDRAIATSALGHRAVLSRLPPPVFRRLAGGFLSQPDNRRESLAFTALGLLEPPLRRFGALAIRDLYSSASLLAPPGLRVVLLPTPRGVRVSAQYLDPATRPQTAARLQDAIDDSLRRFEDEGRRRRAPW